MTILFIPGTPTEFRTTLDSYLKKFFKFDLVVVPSDFNRITSMEVLRWAKKNGIKTIAIQSGLYDRAKIISDWVDWENSKRMPMFLVKIRKYLGHFWYLILKPILQLQKPYFGKSSFVLHTGQSGMRDVDEQWVWDKWQYDILLKDGVPKEKLKIVPPPIELAPKMNSNTVLFVLPSELTLDDKHIKIWQETIEIFEGWNKLIKPHPSTKIKLPFETLSPQDPIEEYIPQADLVIGLPPAISTSLYIASLMGKTVVAYDPLKEWRGDFLKGQLNIKYITNYADLLQFAKTIQG